MKFTIHMKTPDAVDYACKEAVAEYDEDDDPIISTNICYDLKELCQKWFKHSESVNIEIDTEAGTATVLEARA